MTDRLLQDFSEADPWVIGLFDRMLAQQLTTAEFESVVNQHWHASSFLIHAPGAARHLRQSTAELDTSAGYASDAPNLGFRSQWLVGVPGRPGAIHIHAPPERIRGHRRLSQLNRIPHQHNSGRMALVTRGSAIFHTRRILSNGHAVMVRCPVAEGHLILWPAWTPHTFDACEGFSVISAMADYVSPAEDGFTFALPCGEQDLDTVPSMTLAEFMRQQDPRCASLPPANATRSG